MIESLALYEKILSKWQKTCNLVGPKVLPQIQEHFLEAEIAGKLAPTSISTWLDIGSGGGLPGVVFACLFPHTHIHLVESKSRKCAFLEEVVQKLQLNATVHWKRVEEMPSIMPDMISARAVGSVKQTLSLALPHFAPHTKILLFQSAEQRKQLPETGIWQPTNRGFALLLNKEEATNLKKTVV